MVLLYVHLVTAIFKISGAAWVFIAKFNQNSLDDKDEMSFIVSDDCKKVEYVMIIWAYLILIIFRGRYKRIRGIETSYEIGVNKIIK